MPSTRLQLRQKLGETETGLAVLGTCTATGTTTTIVDTARFLGPFSASTWPRGTAVRISTITGGTVTATTDTYIDQYAPATGILTVSPAIVAPVENDTFEVWSGVGNFPGGGVQLVDKCIDLGLTRHCFHLVPIPLTKVTDGDMGDPLYANWTASGATVTPSKVSMSFPETLGKRYLRTLHNTTAGAYVYSATMNAQGGDTWRLVVNVKAAVGTAVLAVYDVTNSANITLSGDGGSYAGAAWSQLDNTFVIPSTCKQIRIHLSGTGATDDIYWTNVICYEQNESMFALPSRIRSENKIGEVLYRLGDDPNEYSFYPYCVSGRHADIQREATGIVVRLSSAMGDPVFVETLIPYEALATDAATTECDEELALKAIAFEVYKELATKGYALPTPQGYLAPSEWRQKRDEKLREMQSCQLNAEAQSKAVWR